MKVLGISGSLRAGSYNRALLRAAVELAPAGTRVEQWEIRDLPFYDGDLEAEGDPASVAAFKEAIRAADAVVIASPEYNHGVPGVLKNAVDWASRPVLASPLAGKPIGLMGASTGQGGTRRAQEQLRAALACPGAAVLAEPEILVPRAYEYFDASGRLTDPNIRESVRSLLEALAAAGRSENISLVAA